MKNFDVAVVGAFYNTSWIASELSRKGWSVLYLDLMEGLGRWSMEDIEGPFGFFSSETLSPYFQEKLHFEESYQNLENGWTLWLPTGPLEFKSPLINYQLSKRQVSSSFVESLSDSTEKFYKQKPGRKFSSEEFSKNWLEYLSHYLTQTHYSSYAEPEFIDHPLPLMNSFYVRSLSRRSLERAEQWLSHQNIQASKNTKILDLSSTHSHTIDGFELKGEFSGIVKFKKLVWSLSAEETYFYNPRLGKTLFENGFVEPEWVWSRYTLEISLSTESSQLPLYSVWIMDLNAPWTHENLLIFQRTQRENQLDVWVKIPNSQRFNKDYLKYYGDKIVAAWVKRLESSEVKVSHFPQEYEYTYQEMGPQRWAQFSKKTQSQRLLNKFRNVYFHSYENLKSLNKETQFQGQNLIAQTVMQKLKQEVAGEMRAGEIQND